MKPNKHKYQKEYENTTGLFWENKPAKYVKLFTESILSELVGLDILDLGAGEGKNSVYLASLGCKVVAVDISPIALSKFNMQDNYESCKENITTINCNILDLKFQDKQFDIVVAYGIFHCLADKEQIKQVVERLKKWTKKGGYFIGATFTDNIPPPDIQDYLEYESFLSDGDFERMFADWKIIKSENDVITESHPTTQVLHSHSITRIITSNL